MQKIDPSSGLDTLSSSQEESLKNPGIQAASREAGFSNREASLSRVRIRSKSRCRINDDTIFSDSSPDKRSRLRESKAGPSQSVGAQALAGQSGSGYDASSSGSSPKAGPSSAVDTPEISLPAGQPPRKKRKYGCKGKRSDSRPKRDIGVLQGLCVLSTQMLGNKSDSNNTFIP